jgi:hypothetical protein
VGWQESWWSADLSDPHPGKDSQGTLCSQNSRGRVPGVQTGDDYSKKTESKSESFNSMTLVTFWLGGPAQRPGIILNLAAAGQPGSQLALNV